MPTVELDIRQLADEGGTAPLAPITVTDAVLDEDGNTLTDILDELKAGLTYNWTSYLSSSEQDSSALVTAMVTYNIVVLSIRTKSTTHAEDGVIMNIPEGFRPITNTHGVGKVGSHELCTILANTNGNVSIWSMNQSSSGRFVCQIVYVYR